MRRLLATLFLSAAVCCVVTGCRERKRAESAAERPASVAPPAVVAPEPGVLPEMHRTNLALVAGRWTVPGQTNGFTGWFLDTYGDGTPRSRSLLSNGLAHGPSTGWYTNGVRQVEEHFVRGFSEGVRTKWYESGATQSVATLVSGRVDGVFRRWYETGGPWEELSLRADVPDGVSRAFYTSGFLKSEAVLRQGSIVTQRFWKDGERRIP